MLDSEVQALGHEGDPGDRVLVTLKLLTEIQNRFHPVTMKGITGWIATLYPWSALEEPRTPGGSERAADGIVCVGFPATNPDIVAGSGWTCRGPGRITRGPCQRRGDRCRVARDCRRNRIASGVRNPRGSGDSRRRWARRDRDHPDPCRFGLNDGRSITATGHEDGADPARQWKSLGNNRSVIWLSGLACGVLAAVAPGIATVAGGLLAPGVTALKLDREPGRPVARAVLTCGLAGCVHPVITLWNTGQSLETAIAIVTDPTTTGTAWAAAAAGWLLSQVAPLVVRVALEAVALARTTRLRAARSRIVEAWGLDEASNDE